MNFQFSQKFSVGNLQIDAFSAPLLVAETACAHDGEVSEAKNL